MPQGVWGRYPPAASTDSENMRELGVSRDLVSKLLRSGEIPFAYERRVQPVPKEGPWASELDGLDEQCTCGS